MNKVEYYLFSVHESLLLETLQRAYLKINCGDESIGWTELCDEMQATLCEVMGDDEFCNWLEEEVDE